MPATTEIGLNVPSEQEVYLFREGTQANLHTMLGCHFMESGQFSERGATAHFGVWAPNARMVSVIGDWNGWDSAANPLAPRYDSSGIWEGTFKGVRHGQAYKYAIVSGDGSRLEKADPVGFFCELPPATASRTWSLDYAWQDEAWMKSRAARNGLDSPMAIYEAHLGSWRRKDGGFLSYREFAHALADYLTEMRFTHVELMPITEHPFYGSWGYQTTGYFAPTARYGTPQDLMYLVDHLHQRGIGVILDWVPSHFPNDAHGLFNFDGTHLYDHADPRQGYHPEWNSAIFNYGRNEVRSFLISSASFWFEKYHIDGIRVDAVASMLYLDYARKEGEWIPNRYGGRENLEAIHFLRTLNEAIYRDHPGVAVIAEESTSWPLVSRPTSMGGLGFGMKWNMGWMHDSLKYMEQNPLFRRYHHGELTFSLIYAFNENFVLPLSHDEVVYGKHSLIAKMPGDDWQMFANLRALYGYMWGHPGKKLLFMGGEFAQRREWTHEGELEWWVTGLPEHAGVRNWMRDLNQVYRSERALHQVDFTSDGFEWIDADNAEMSIIAFVRKSTGAPPVLVVCNFTPVPRSDFLVGIPTRGAWREILNSDARDYGGSGWGNMGGVQSVPISAHGRTDSLNLNLPPLATIMLRWEGHA